ncbi:hypothetical protein ACF0H5_011154 [Mactra antiquata]
MNYGKRVALSRTAPLTDSDSAIGEDYEDENRSHKKAGGGKDKLNRNLSEKKRRDQFNMLVNELCTMVSTTSKKMDKSTVLKSTISFLKDHQETTDQAHEHEIKEDWKPSFLTNDEFMHLMLEACDSFLLVFTQHGIVLYTSESVTSLLGHLPADMVNRSIYDYVGKTESANLHNLLYNYRVVSGNGVPEYENEENQLCFDCNFRRGAIDPRVAVQYEPVTVRGSFRRNASPNDEGSQSTNMFGDEQVYFLCTVRLQTSQLVREMSIVDDNREFTSRHSLEWKFLFLDHRAPPIIGYLPFEVLGTSGYDYYHPDDLEGVTVSHEQLMKTGEGVSCYYRFLTKGQQWIWLKTRYFITYHQWNSKPEFINCTNTVVSYADVRGQKRKDLGISEEEPSPQDQDNNRSILNMSRSPSVGSVTSGGRSESSFCTLSDKDNGERSQHPTSTSQVRSRTVSQQLQKFLHRHLQQQQQQQQQQQPQSSIATQSAQSQLLQTTSVTSSSSYTSMPLQHLVYGQQQKTESPVRILPRTATIPSNSGQTGQPSLPAAAALQQLTAINSSSDMSLKTTAPSQMTITPINVSVSPSVDVYMTPVQRQLHEQLRRKAGQVQDAILRQQEELRKIHQQLLFAEGNIPMINSNSDNMLAVLGGEQSLQSQPTLPTRPQVPTQQQTIGQQRQSMEQAQENPSMVPMHNVIVNQSQVLPFSMLPQDAEVYLSLSDSHESSLQTFNN